MTPALTLLIASSAGWAAPEARPTGLEVQLLIAAVEMAVITETMATASVDLAEAPATRFVPALSAPAVALPILHDLRSIVRYSLSLPWVRTKP